MTCIVGIAQGGKVYLGGDSAGIAGFDLTIRSDPKVFRKGPFLIGYTSSYRMGQLLRFRFDPPAHHPPEMDPFEFMATTFIDAVRECLSTGGYAKKENEQEEGGCFLVGYRGVLYCVGEDYQVGIASSGFDAVGCADAAARGALYATRGDDPETRIRVSLEAAEHCNIGVRGPFVIERLDE